MSSTRTNKPLTLTSQLSKVSSVATQMAARRKDLNNMATSFYETHRANVQLNALSGICVPGKPHSSNRTQRFMYYYCRVLAAVGVIHVILLFFGMFQNQSLASFTTVVVPFGFRMFDVFAIIYFIINEEKFHQLVLDFDHVTSLCIEDPLSDVGFLMRLESNYKKHVTMVTSIAPWVLAFMGIAFFLPAYIQSMAWFGHHGRKEGNTKLWMPCDNNTSPCYDVMLFFQLIMGTLSVVQKLSYELFFISLYLFQCSYFQHLKSSMANVFNQNRQLPNVVNKSNDNLKLQICENYLLDDSNAIRSYTQGERFANSLIGNHDGLINGKANYLSTTKVRLHHWTKVHQNVLRLGTDLCQLDSYLYSAYLGHIIWTMTFCLFAITETSNEMKLSDTFLILAYGTVFNLVPLGVICLIGDWMSQESMNVAEEGFWLHWKVTSKESKSSLEIILARTMKPLGTSSIFPSAKLNVESFVALCNLIVSYYLAMVKIKEKSADHL